MSNNGQYVHLFPCGCQMTKDIRTGENILVINAQSIQKQQKHLGII